MTATHARLIDDSLELVFDDPPRRVRTPIHSETARGQWWADHLRLAKSRDAGGVLLRPPRLQGGTIRGAAEQATKGSAAARPGSAVGEPESSSNYAVR